MAAPETTPTQGPGIAGVLPIALALGLFTWFASFLPTVAAGEVVRLAWDWVPSLGIALSFTIDGLSLTFSLLISGIGTLVFLYSRTYLGSHKQFARFVLFLASFMLAMLGLVLADNLIALFVFWELTTITSYLLIGFGHEGANSRRSALQALFVTGAGALALLAGFILLGFTAGSFELSEIVKLGPQITSDPMYPAILVLVLAGAFTKSAQFPFHFWLPNAMAAPTPVSAFLHSATMVKAGVYLMARLHPALSGTDVWMWTLTIAGVITAVFASVVSIRQTDIKQTLAYTTLMALGTLTALLGQSSEYAMTAFATFLVTHSLYKASLFLMIGCVDYSTGTRDANALGGLARAMPVTAAAAGLAALSMAGLPPFIGFISKELQYAGALEVQTSVIFVAAGALAANALMFAVAGIAAYKPFWRPAQMEFARTPKEAPATMVAGPILLATLGLIFGLMPGIAATYLVAPTVATFLGTTEAAKELKLWAGVNIPLFLSLATFALGFVLYALHGRMRAALAAMEPALPNFDSMWDKFLVGLKAFAAWQTRIIQTGYLRQYLVWTFLTILLTLAGTMVLRGVMPAMPDLTQVTWMSLALALLTAAGAIMAAVTGSRIMAMAALGVVGIGVAMLFIVFAAPDVAITQLLVETLVVVLVAVALLRLPSLDRPGESDWRPRDALLGAAIGTVITLIMLSVLQQPLDLTLTDYFEATSWPEAFGRNIVNVILVDFRALDTFGEIAVVVIAALSSYALLRTTDKGGAK
ncbi:MAG: putative monovalent cation/H+ antiporter subunit A [Pseudomonadota bacterium]